jgi:hypothetical protein
MLVSGSTIDRRLSHERTGSVLAKIAFGTMTG